jgi:hypothetical protein
VTVVPNQLGELLGSAFKGSTEVDMKWTSQLGTSGPILKKV